MLFSSSSVQGRLTELFSYTRRLGGHVFFLLVPSLLFITNIGEKIYQDLTVAVSLAIAVFMTFREKVHVPSDLVKVWLAWLTYIAWSVFTDSYAESALYWEAARNLLLLAVLPAFYLAIREGRERYREALLSGFKLALVTGFGIAVYQVGVMGERAHGNENALIFGALMAVYAIFVAEVDRDRAASAESSHSGGVWWLALGGGALALSGSRGVALAYGLVVVALFLQRRRFAALVKLVLGVIALVWAVDGGRLLANRFVPDEDDLSVVQELYSDHEPVRNGGTGGGGAASADDLSVVQESYSEQEPARIADTGGRESVPVDGLSSSQLRLSYWLGALRVISEHPWLGVGSTSEMAKIEAALGWASGTIEYSHVHNVLLQNLITGGVPKLVLLLIGIAVPVMLLRARGARVEARVLFLCSLLLLLTGVTNIVFEVASLGFVYALVLAFCLLGGAEDKVHDGRKLDLRAMR